MKKKLKVLVVQLFFLAIFLELGLALCTTFGFVNLGQPTYNFKGIEHFWNLPDSTIATWRTPGHRYRHMTSCFNVEYMSNQQGMRDLDRQEQSEKKRFLVLGDSFTEGWGVDLEDRYTNQLEEKTGVEFLNFGISNSGLTQQYLLYKTFASVYDHDAVIWTIFPENDLLDDDPKVGEAIHKDQYKPYWYGTAPNYQLRYGPLSFEAAKQKKSGLGGWQGVLRNFTYTYHLIRYLKLRYVAQSPEARNYLEGVTGYFELTHDQWSRIKHNISLLQQWAGEKPIYLVTIPGKYNIISAISQEGLNTPLSDSLKVYSQEKGFAYFDLLDVYRKEDAGKERERYFDCDTHWSPEGHQWVAQVIDSVFNLSGTFTTKQQ